MADLAAIERHAVTSRRMAKNGIDRLQHRCCRPEGYLERNAAPVLPRLSNALFEMPVHLEKGSWIRALKAVDGLLCIADGEDCAEVVPGALTREELLGQSRDDGPLLRVRVLRFVDQNTIETAVELEQHPGRDPGPPQQIERDGHEVIIIEHTLHPLALGIGVHQRAAEPGQGPARLHQHYR